MISQRLDGANQCYVRETCRCTAKKFKKTSREEHSIRSVLESSTAFGRCLCFFSGMLQLRNTLERSDYSIQFIRVQNIFTLYQGTHPQRLFEQRWTGHLSITSGIIQN